jgi:hypothetical protein
MKRTKDLKSTDEYEDEDFLRMFNAFGADSNTQTCRRLLGFPEFFPF